MKLIFYICREWIIIKEEILQSVKKVCEVEDNRYDEFILFYFTFGEGQIERYLKAKKLTSTLYLLIYKYIIFKVETAIKKETILVFEEDEKISRDCLKHIYFIDDFFMEHSRLLNNYRRLVKLESWIKF